MLNAWAGHKLVLLYYFPTVHFINEDYKAEALGFIIYMYTLLFTSGAATQKYWGKVSKIKSIVLFVSLNLRIWMEKLGRSRISV